MEKKFAILLHKLRTEKKLTQQQLADMLFVDRSSVAHWEIGRRIPDAIIISRLAQCLNADISVLLEAASHDESQNGYHEVPEGANIRTNNVIVLDPDGQELHHSVSVLKDTLPSVFKISGFSKPEEALSFFEENPVCMVFTETRSEGMNGNELCDMFFKINPRTNLIFLTGSRDFALKAWETPASGYILKPLDPEILERQFRKLRNPVAGL